MDYEESFGVIPIRKHDDKWQVFLVKIKSGNHWGFPKGHKEENEDPKSSAERELQEETNLTVVSYYSEEPFVEKYNFKRNERDVFKSVYYFLVEVKGDIKIQKNEVIDSGWFFIDDAIDKITYSQSKEICQKVKNFIHNLND